MLSVSLQNVTYNGLGSDPFYMPRESRIGGLCGTLQVSGQDQLYVFESKITVLFFTRRFLGFMNILIVS
jgi:hypothetical protein